MQPEDFSIINMYGDRDFFQQKLSAGFTEIAFGRGAWVGDLRIVAIWVFYHPNGEITTLQQPKTKDDGGSTLRPDPFERQYTKSELEAYLDTQRITLGEKTSLEATLEVWEG